MGNHLSHTTQLYQSWDLLQTRKRAGEYVLTGDQLHAVEVVATAFHGGVPKISRDPAILKGLQDSVDVLYEHLAKGHPIYGVNAGPGAGARNSTTDAVALQSSLMQMTQTGILSRSPDGSMTGHSMPSPWVRGAIVARCNSILRGHSAITLPVVEAMLALLQHNINPVVPLRGSVSSSGDLMPFSYIAGTIEGNPDILVERNGRVLPAPQALKEAGLQPIKLGPKEGLGLVNGTAMSVAVSAIVITQAHLLALLTQVLTAMAVEALHGSRESFNQFTAQARPHLSQAEVTANINYFLEESRLVRDDPRAKNCPAGYLIQDRYSIRSAPQWIGPQLDDLNLADQQINTELNSTCDNPLIDVSTRSIHYGCNFQASCLTSAMEKVRLSLQMFGRLLFSQLSEMIDPNLSQGLPANLTADDPSTSFTMKGVEVNMAAYMAELSYYASPMSPFVQAAEMHNQSVNSMALASARMSMHATEILTLMTATHLYAVCQALDLRALHMEFLRNVTEAIASVTKKLFSSTVKPQELQALLMALESHMFPAWSATGSKDPVDRCAALASTALPIVINHVRGLVTDVAQWKDEATRAAFATWRRTFDAFCAEPHTPKVLGKGARVLYQFVRGELGVPFHQGFIEHPTIRCEKLHGRPKKTIGSWISLIHDAIENGSLYHPLMTLIGKGLKEPLNDSPPPHKKG
ncbi:phenylalanine ammonia-lyase [Durotheca rogersii]|uniref:phenylalanine ammonia-lyase n=1 Tax=Durotheca rogersii TaxID=419775 RepID=UPI00221FB1DF|nr:phenylalanine ammonia-lyase [Durotheca rogersii]KAI5866820.1 phenylalanine ammonia-lyase [Durotheca rogersii]